MAQHLWLLKDASKSINAKKAALGPLHLAKTGTKVTRMRQVCSQVMAAVMEIKWCTVWLEMSATFELFLIYNFYNFWAISKIFSDFNTQPIRDDSLFTVSMSAGHVPSSRQSAADTLVEPFFPFLTPLFVTPACIPREPSMPSCRHAVTVPPFAHVYKHIQGILTAWLHDGIDGYRGIHAGVTKSGVKSK